MDMTANHSNDFYRGERVTTGTYTGIITRIRNNNYGTTYTVRCDDGTTFTCGPYALRLP